MENKIAVAFLIVSGIALSLNAAYAQEYLCIVYPPNGSVGDYKYDPSISLEDAKKQCESFKDNSFWGPEYYQRCVATIDAKYKAYNEGKCKLLYKKEHVKGSNKCVVDYYFKDSTSDIKYSAGTLCSGPDIDSLKEDLKKIYKGIYI